MRHHLSWAPTLFRYSLAALLLAFSTLAYTGPILAQDQAVVPTNLVHFDMSGNRFRLADHVRIPGEFPPLPGQAGPVILVFGAHWCAPCHDVLTTLSALRPRLSEAGVSIVYVHVDDADRGSGMTREEITQAVATMAEDPIFEGVRILLGGDMTEVRQWANDPAADSLPLTLFIRADGIIAAKTSGSDDTMQLADRFLVRLAAGHGGQVQNP